MREASGRSGLDSVPLMSLSAKSPLTQHTVSTIVTAQDAQHPPSNLLVEDYMAMRTASPAASDTAKVKCEVKVAQSRPTLCDPMDCSPPGSSVHGDSAGQGAGVGCHFLLLTQLREATVFPMII